MPIPHAGKERRIPRMDRMMLEDRIMDAKGHRSRKVVFWLKNNDIEHARECSRSYAKYIAFLKKCMTDLDAAAPPVMDFRKSVPVSAPSSPRINVEILDGDYQGDF